LVVLASQKEREERLRFLNSVALFDELPQEKKFELLEVLQIEDFEDEEAIVEEGEVDDKMFFIQKGEAVACVKSSDNQQIEVMRYSKGGFFGEIALLTDSPRKATVYAVGKMTCLYVDRQIFQRLLGPITQILQHGLRQYETVTKRLSDPSAQIAKGAKENVAAYVPARKTVYTRTSKKYDFKPDEVLHCRMEVKETLADRLQRDYANPAFVQPNDKFSLAAVSHVHGLISPKLEYTQECCFIQRCDLPGVKNEKQRETFTLTSSSRLSKGSWISASGTKGVKQINGAKDPTPCQDNYFVIHLKSGVELYGVCDGHGPMGHVVSFRIVQSLPYFLTTSAHFADNMEDAIREAFAKTDEDLRSFAAEHSLNLDSSGSTCSLVIVKQQTIFTAVVGDSTVIIGSWSRFVKEGALIAKTINHIGAVDEERKRIETAGGVCREDAPGHFRLFLPGEEVPGLSMTRCFGDFSMSNFGLIAEPSIHSQTMQPGDEWFIVAIYATNLKIGSSHSTYSLRAMVSGNLQYPKRVVELKLSVTFS